MILVKFFRWEVQERNSFGSVPLWKEKMYSITEVSLK